ncbi:hypothetical protein, partial [Serratia fonticola]
CVQCSNLLAKVASCRSVWCRFNGLALTWLKKCTQRQKVAMMNKSHLAVAIRMAIEEQSQQKHKPVSQKMFVAGRQCGMTRLKRLWMQAKGIF